MGHLVFEKAQIVRVYPLCAVDHVPREIRSELDPAFENALVLAGWYRRHPEHKGIYATAQAWWGDDQYGKWIEGTARYVWSKLPEAKREALGRPVWSCWIIKRYALKDGDRDWVQTYPWSRLRAVEEIPGWVGAKTGVKFEGLPYKMAE